MSDNPDNEVGISSSSDTAGRGKQRGARRRARELAMQGVYAWLVRGDTSLRETGEIDAHLRDSPDFVEADAQWYHTLLHGVFTQAESLRNTLEPHLDRSVSSLSPIEHAVLLIACFELVNHIEVPYRAVINEAVELTKSFGGTDGFKFVNGVLDKVALNVRTAEVQAAQAQRRR